MSCGERKKKKRRGKYAAFFGKNLSFSRLHNTHSRNQLEETKVLCAVCRFAVRRVTEKGRMCTAADQENGEENRRFRLLKGIR